MNEKYSIWLSREKNERVGTLILTTVRGRLTSAFVYDTSWLSSPFSFPLSPDLPLDTTPLPCAGLYLCFQDCSPDRWGRNLLMRQERARAYKGLRRPRTLLDSDFLLGVNDFTRQGALRISADEGVSFLEVSDKSSVPPLVFLPKLLTATRHLEEQKDSEEDLKMLISPGSSLGGARPKASVIDADGSLLIAKFPSHSDTRDIPLWEYVNFRLARRAALSVPDARLENIAGKNVLLVKRFDREGLVRVPFISAMSMLSAKDGESASYADIAAVLQESGASPAQDLRELWSRMVFNMCVYNVDDHLRNHGFLRATLGWRLSPVYDLENSTPVESSPYLHTALIDDVFELNLKYALEVADLFRFSAKEAKERLAQIRAAVACWKQEAQAVKASSEDLRTMRDAYEYLA